MNKRIKKSWIEALRSGKYKQGRGLLRAESSVLNEADDTYCCLGVLFDLNLKLDDDGWLKDDDTTDYFSVMHYSDDEWPTDGFYNEGELSRKFLTAVGMEKPEEEALICLNDGTRMGAGDSLDQKRSKTFVDYIEGLEPQDFDVIANYIEDNL